ncbi:aldehyde dehydrogenase family protein [Phyllobacterium endophyticum]|uniref:aldehyde dehydrogenase family protein n=1 Tax=Phyllobacterium endophyticum TaxID=1149773 RepID=UPI001FEDAC7E|nr:aldehyde dehydrogenase family protein [Phyllobacterium endophyticum]
MELDGHAPVIVFEDAYLEKAPDTVVASKFCNTGQVCTSPTRFYVEEFIYKGIIEGFAARAGKIKVGNGLGHGVEMGPMIAPRRLDAMDARVNDALCDGAKIVIGCERVGNERYFYARTLYETYRTMRG